MEEGFRSQKEEMEKELEKRLETQRENFGKILEETQGKTKGEILAVFEGFSKEIRD